MCVFMLNKFNSKIKYFFWRLKFYFLKINFIFVFLFFFILSIVFGFFHSSLFGKHTSPINVFHRLFMKLFSQPTFPPSITGHARRSSACGSMDSTWSFLPNQAVFDGVSMQVSLAEIVRFEPFFCWHLEKF